VPLSASGGWEGRQKCDKPEDLPLSFFEAFGGKAGGNLISPLLFPVSLRKLEINFCNV